MTLSTKPEIHANNASHCCHHGRTEPRSRVMCMENFVIHVVLDFQKNPARAVQSFRDNAGL